MTGRVCLITGSTGGIGFETAAALADAGATVLVHGRSREKTQAAAERVGRGASAVIGDFARLDDVRRLADEIAQKHGQLDVLINNAGLYRRGTATTADGFGLTVQVNHLAPFVLTARLMPNLLAARRDGGFPRVVNLSSRAHETAPKLAKLDLDRADEVGGWKAYATSKLYNIWFTRELHRRYRPLGVSSNAVHPGVIATDIFRDLPGMIRVPMLWFLKGPKEGAATTIHLATHEAGGAISGKYWRDCHLTDPTPDAQDNDAAKQLWQWSEQVTGTTWP
jgi:NAD(P)-dependent dehydrogenase (short-subunit alcohol dehydrogenase family)